MGRNGGRQWGETVAAYGEISMAAVSRSFSRSHRAESPELL